MPRYPPQRMDDRLGDLFGPSSDSRRAASDEESPAGMAISVMRRGPTAGVSGLAKHAGAHPAKVERCHYVWLETVPDNLQDGATADAGDLRSQSGRASGS
jgi:hypothetical protein